MNGKILRSGVEIESFLRSNGIEFMRFDHEPVMTCEAARKALPGAPGAETKNLFLRDGKGRRHALLVTTPERNVDLKALGAELDMKGLGLASPERLLTALGIEPGSVTLLAVANDSSCAVELIIDEELWNADRLLCHPLVNTATLSIARRDLETFLGITGHIPRVMRIPERV